MQENKKVNQRIVATKRALQDALIEMLKTQNINSISIRELCQAAKVNRTTFYNHYGSQFDVLNEIAETHLQNGYHVVVKEKQSPSLYNTVLLDFWRNGSITTAPDLRRMKYSSLPPLSAKWQFIYNRSCILQLQVIYCNSCIYQNRMQRIRTGS